MKTASDTAPAARPIVERGADRKQQAAALYASGKSTYEIAPLFGVSAVTIGNWLKALGVPRRAAADHGRQRELEKNPLRAHRSDQGLTRKALAGMVGVSDSAITGIENGHHRPSLQLAQRSVGRHRPPYGERPTSPRRTCLPLTAVAVGIQAGFGG